MKFYIGDKVRMLDDCNVLSKDPNFDFVSTHAGNGEILTVYEMRKFSDGRIGFAFEAQKGFAESCYYDKRGLELVKRGPNAPKRHKKKAKKPTEEKPTPKFKVGDRVIGNDEERYFITKKGWIGTVVRANKFEIDAKGPDDAGNERTFKCLEPKYFDIYTGDPEKAEETTKPETTEKPKEGKTLERGELVKTFMKLTETDRLIKQLADVSVLRLIFTITIQRIENAIFKDEK